MKCYIDFFDSKNSFKETRKDFDNDKDAMQFMIETFDAINSDFINYY
jgi:hypothetical protein